MRNAPSRPRHTVRACVRVRLVQTTVTHRRYLLLLVDIMDRRLMRPLALEEERVAMVVVGQASVLPRTRVGR